MICASQIGLGKWQILSTLISSGGGMNLDGHEVNSMGKADRLDCEADT